MIKSINNAMAKRRAMQDGENDKGFTLIELMVVIIIIGILAAIAIPAFLNQRQAAWDATTKSDIANAEIAAASYSVDHNGTYTGMTAAVLQAAPYNFAPSGDTSAVTISPSTDGTTYTASAWNKNFGATSAAAGAAHVWTYTSTSGVIAHG